MRTRFSAFFFLLLLLFGTRSAWADFSDDCASPQNDDWHRYAYFLPARADASVDFSWPSAPDRTALLAEQGAGVAASALYAVEGATQLSISLYSVLSTFATRGAAGWAPGYPAGGSVAGAQRLLLSKDADEIYLQSGGWWALRRDAYGESAFHALSGAPAGGLKQYGLTVLCSPDGSVFTPVPAALRAARCSRDDGAGFSCYYETYLAPVPSGTRFIRVELREAASFALEGGGSVANSTRGSMRLASVTFLGPAVRGSLEAPSPGPSPSVPADSSAPVAPPSTAPSSSDPDLQTPNPGQGGTGGASEAPERSSRSSSSRASSQRSSSSSRTAGAKTAPRASSSRSSAGSTASRSASTAAPERPPAPRAPEPERAASTRSGEEQRTLLLGGAYLVGASAILVLLVRKK